MIIDKCLNWVKKNKQISMLISLLFMIVIMTLIQNNIIKLFMYAVIYISMLAFLFLMCKNKKNISLLVVFSIFHMVFIGIGPIPLAIRKGIFFPKTYNIILMSYYVFCVTTYFIYNSNKYMGKINNYTKKIDNKKNINLKKIVILSYVLIVISLIAEAIYLIKNFQLLFGGNMEDGRITSLQGNGILLYVMWFGLVGLCLLWELVLEKKFNLKVFISLYLVYGLSSVLIGFRSRIITLILFTILLYIQKRKVNFKKISIIGILILIGTGILGTVRSILSGSSGAETFLSFYTLFDNGVFNINHIMTFFPERVNFQYGYTFLLNIIMLKPGPDLDFTLWLKKSLNMNFAGGGVTPTLVGELYINFGYIGTLIGFALVAIILIILDEIYKNKKSTFNVVVIIWAILMSCRGGLANAEINVLVFLLVYNISIYVSSDKFAKKMNILYNKLNKSRRGQEWKI